jgi:hypothetical protein
MADADELAVLKDVARRLRGSKVPYMITGSIAANFYTTPRMTRDIDIVVELSERDTDRFVRLFQDHFYLEPATVQEAVRSKGMFNLIHNEFIVKVDFVVRKDTQYRRTEFSRKRRIVVDGEPISVVAVEDLILSKLVWAKDSGSEAQLRDVRNLFDSGKRLDRHYLVRWATRLGILSLYKKVMK